MERSFNQVEIGIGVSFALSISTRSRSIVVSGALPLSQPSLLIVLNIFDASTTSTVRRVKIARKSRCLFSDNLNFVQYNWMQVSEGVFLNTHSANRVSGKCVKNRFGRLFSSGAKFCVMPS